MLKSNPDSLELLRSLINLSFKWLSECSEELSNGKKNEIVCNAEKIAEKLRNNPEDIHSSHCLMYEIYFRAGNTEKAEAELMYFSASGQYTRDRARYMHLLMSDKYEEALPYIESSLQHTLNWLRWDIGRLKSVGEKLTNAEAEKRISAIKKAVLSEI